VSTQPSVSVKGYLLTLGSFYYGTVVFAGTGIKNSFVTQMILVSASLLQVLAWKILTSPERHKLRRNLLWPLHRRALRSSQIPHRRLNLDVYLFHDLRLRRPLRTRPREPREHRKRSHSHDMFRVFLYLWLRDNLGSYDVSLTPLPSSLHIDVMADVEKLDHLRRTLPQPLPR
jgi:hypothetical protein